MGGAADFAVGGRDDRGGIDHATGRVAGREPRRGAAMVVAGGRRQREPGRERHGSGADSDRPGDRRQAVLRPDRLVRVRRAAATAHRPETPPRGPRQAGAGPARSERNQRPAGRDLRRQAWRWAEANRGADGSLPSGKAIGAQFARHERWGRLIKRMGVAGE